MPRASSASTYGRVTSTARSSRSAGRAGRRAWPRPSPASLPLRSVTFQSLSLTSQSTKAPTASGSDCLDRPAGYVAACHTVRARAGRRSMAAPACPDRCARERHVVGLQRQGVAGHDRRERRVHERLDFGRAAEAGRQMNAAARPQRSTRAQSSRRARHPRDGTGRSTAWDRRRGTACRATVDALRQSVSLGSSAARSRRISAWSGSVSWNSSTKMRVKRS